MNPVYFLMSSVEARGAKPGKFFLRYAEHVVVLAAICAVLAHWQLRYYGYVKDDTFISMRYARNLALGHGLVFNYGDRLEGYTNFLWVLMTVPAVWLKVDVLTWVKVMSCIFGHLGVVTTYAIARFFSSGRSIVFPATAALLYALSPTVILWSTSGMEPTLMAVLCGGGTLYGMRLWSRDTDPAPAAHLAVISALLLSLGALCRPDAHAVIIVAGVFAWLDALREGRVPRVWLLWGGIILAILVPYHLFRVAYFGDLFPNTAYVKAAAGPEVWKRGLGFAKSLLGFVANPVIFGLAVAGVVASWYRGQHRVPRLWALTVGAVFILYMIKIGRDEMKWFRLFLPVYPLVVALGVDGLRQLSRPMSALGDSLYDRVPTVDPVPRLAVGKAVGGGLPALLAIVLAVWGGMTSWDYAKDRAKWHNAYVRSSEASFQAMGKYIAKRSDPGDVVVFQDMGAAPWSAPEQEWVDTIGILNRTVGKELARIKLNPFLRSEKKAQPGGREQVAEFERRVRDYVFSKDPDWIAFVAYVPKKRRKKFRNRYNKIKDGRKDHQVIGDEEVAAHFKKRIERNGHALGIARDRRFKRDYEFVRVWKRDPNLRTWGRRRGYWLVLYRAIDRKKRG